MRRPVKVKALATRVPLRKAATSATSVARRAFPAWIDANEGAVVFSARSATPRVRDGLVLRTVAKKKAAKNAGPSHGRSDR